MFLYIGLLIILYGVNKYGWGLIVANKEFAFQSQENADMADELTIAVKELTQVKIKSTMSFL